MARAERGAGSKFTRVGFAKGLQKVQAAINLRLKSASIKACCERF